MRDRLRDYVGCAGNVLTRRRSRIVCLSKSEAGSTQDKELPLCKRSHDLQRYPESAKK
ncbi:hypothetical protein D9M68_781990 [compost metagenome]